MSAVAPPPAWPMYRALVGIGMACGLVIAVVVQLTRPAIERNHAEALQRAVFAVLPAATGRAAYTAMPDGSIVAGEAPGGDRLHAGYDANGKLVGVAIEAAGMGYADTIRVLYGYAPSTETIVGFRVLSSKETPGLGDKIELDPRFLDNFAALDAALDSGGLRLANAIVTVKQGAKANPWQIDGITGATVSSKAVGDMLNDSAGRLLPAIQNGLDVLEAGGPDDGA